MLYPEPFTLKGGGSAYSLFVAYPDILNTSIMLINKASVQIRAKDSRRLGAAAYGFSLDFQMLKSHLWFKMNFQPEKSFIILFIATFCGVLIPS